MKSYTLDDLLYLMNRLRDPQTGCPWDIKQDFASIVPHTLEEAYEVADTIERKDWPHLQDELGDLLFQVIFYAQLGKEQNSFDFESVIDGLVTKLIRRHPHVFPDGELTAERVGGELTDAEIKANWEAIKRQERADKPVAKMRVLDDVPRTLPAITRAEKLTRRASQVGFDWGAALPVLDKIEEEIAELREAIAEGNLDEVRDEFGDLLFAQVNLARHLGINPDTALRGCNQKFERRFNYIEDQVDAGKGDWHAYSLDELDAWWDEAKLKGL
ncbi:nucleoside triphosphate pyrophosphohydrolase [Aliamphritea ceti]|uniref:nucleoside triphosphate pyrophosphohydrolase n=1 Tax=Aliamphritea ceti TaxID=1524258 RepID=UPI0021C3A32F|nr:nucleoside triphosphate pyrophosphohydrolase [Aliamphritea ceti]